MPKVMYDTRKEHSTVQYKYSAYKIVSLSQLQCTTTWPHVTVKHAHKHVYIGIDSRLMFVWFRVIQFISQHTAKQFYAVDSDKQLNKQSARQFEPL